MKTAILKTDFWKDDNIFELLPDARFFYLCLLTNPERNNTAAFKCSDRLLIAFTGYSLETLRLCKQALTKRKLIEIVDGYYIINQQDLVTQNKGKLSSQLYEKDLLLLPLNVQERLLSGTCAAHELYNNNGNNNKSNSNNSKSTKEPKKSEVDEYIALQSSPLKQTLSDFAEYRKSNRKPLTLRALQLLMNKLLKLYPNDVNKQIESLNQSIMNGWAGVFEVQTSKNQKQEDRKFL